MVPSETQVFPLLDERALLTWVACLGSAVLCHALDHSDC